MRQRVAPKAVAVTVDDNGSADEKGLLTGIDTTSPFGTYRARFGERFVWRASDFPLFPAFIRRRLRKRFARPVAGPFDVSHQDVKLRLYPAENYCDRVIFARSTMPERKELAALSPYLRPGMVFVDIGGNVGSYSAFAATQLSGDLTLLTFEPHPRTFAKLVFNLQSNKLPVRHVLNCGVGSEREMLDLWSDGGSNIGHTSMLKEGTANPAISVSVPVVTLLETLLERHITQIDFLKIDIEGFEDRALAPFFDSADPALFPKAMLIEIAHRHLWERDILEMMQERGYRTAFQTKENRLLVLD